MTSIRALLAAALLAWSAGASAGAQMYEPLAASVRAALSKAVSDAGVISIRSEDPRTTYRWLVEMSERMRHRVPDEKTRIELLKTVHYEATRVGVDPQLVLAIIQVESGFKKYAVSSAGARGLMQVMPFWVKVIGDIDHNLFHLRTNLRYGCVILRHYLDIEKDDLFRALGRYNGSLGKAEYPNLVFGAMRHWQFDHRTPGAASRGAPAPG